MNSSGDITIWMVPSLEGHAALLSGIDPRPIRLALYFPLLKGWREWERQP